LECSSHELLLDDDEMTTKQLSHHNRIVLVGAGDTTIEQGAMRAAKGSTKKTAQFTRAARPFGSGVAHKFVLTSLLFSTPVSADLLDPQVTWLPHK